MLVPIIQQASVDYLNDPARANAIILDAVAKFGDDFGWIVQPGRGRLRGARRSRTTASWPTVPTA